MEFKSRSLIFYLKHSVNCIFNENTEEYNAKTPENDVQYSNFNMGEMDKSRDLYSKEGDNSSQIEGKKQLRGNTLKHITLKYYKNNALNLSSKAYTAKTICVFNVTC